MHRLTNGSVVLSETGADFTFAGRKKTTVSLDKVERTRNSQKRFLIGVFEMI